MIPAYLKLLFYFAGALFFGPGMTIFFCFFGDLQSLEYKFKDITPIQKFLHFFTFYDEMGLLFVFGLFWVGFYFILSFWSCLKKIMYRGPTLDWWQTSVVYEIYVRTFCDANGDGVGDFQGIEDKLDYLKSIGINTIWLTPFYPSGGKDGGYDVTSYVDIDPEFGTMADFDKLVAKMHEKNMYAIIDFIPNHTSDQHEWFKESCKSNDKSNKYRDYYVWYPSEDKVNPPNNWVSVFGQSAWAYNENRRAWYLHQFLTEQPDLNFRNPAIRKEIEKAIRFWLEEHNVDGLRVDAVTHLIEDPNFANEPHAPEAAELTSEDRALGYKDLIHIHTANHHENYQLIQEWRDVVDDVSKRTMKKKIMFVEASASEMKQYTSYYKHKKRHNSHFPMNFQFSWHLHHDQHPEKEHFSSDIEFTKMLQGSFTALNLKRLVHDWNRCVPHDCWSNWQIGNHDRPRIGSRIGVENVDLANALNLLLGGTPIVYYGEEIGMTDIPKELISFEQCRDVFGKKYGHLMFSVFSRDYERTPMQWDDSSDNAGFTEAGVTPWLPVNPNYKTKNINVQYQLKEPNSHLRVFMDLMELRQRDSFMWGRFKTHVVTKHVFSFIRDAYDRPTFLVVMNISNVDATVNLQTSNEIAPRAYVAYYMAGKVENLPVSRTSSGINVKEVPPPPNKDTIHHDLHATYKLNAPVLTKSVSLKPRDMLVLTWYSCD